ncbi:hypothetical protein V8F33_009230 [Rhypophila sp. PSN 637]
MAPTTLLPFLYQTRTLQRLARTRATPALQSLFHSTPRHNLPRRVARRPAPAPEPELINEEGKRVRKGKGPAEAAYDGNVPFEGLEFEVEEDPEVLRSSTITVKERDAFDRIFEEIAMRGRAPAEPAPINNRIPGSTGLFMPDLYPDKQNRDKPMDAESFDRQFQRPGQSTREFLNVIVKDAETLASSKDPFHKHHMLRSVKKVADPELALKRFPPSLRKAAKLALGVIDRDRQTDDFSMIHQVNLAEVPQAEEDVAELSALNEIADNKMSDQVAAEALRAVERRRVEGVMRAAKTDFQLWDVLEKEVFSMIERLGISGEPDGTVTGAGKKKRGGKTKDGVDDVEAAGGDGRGKLSMNIYGPLYPSYLLYALRLMDQNFAHPSPMALNLLPRIKELGLMSFVLGVSSPFYNTLARILWYRYGDAKAVLDLLEEMRHVGLFCDGSTQGLVYRIQEYIKDSKNGTHGPFVAEIVDGVDYEFGVKNRLRHWTIFIGKQLEEKRAAIEPALV